MEKPKGNPNILEISKKSTGPKSEIGKFMVNIRKRDLTKVPSELVELFQWYMGMDTKDVNYLLEIQNMCRVLKKNMMPKIIDKLVHGELINKQELDIFKTLIDAADKSNKLKYGDRKVIEKIVTAEDIRKQVFEDKRIINAKVIEDEPVSQNLDRSGRRKRARQENRESPPVD